MKPTFVITPESIDQMIADIADIATSGACPDLPSSKRRSLLEKISTRIDVEPARVYTDAKGCITAVNPAFIRLCGHPFEDLKGCKPGTVLQGPESSNESVSILREAIRNRVPVSTELVNYHKDRSAYRVRIDLKPVFTPSGDLSGYEAEEWKLD
jgi:PAS domain S-box-containing protein